VGDDAMNRLNTVFVLVTAFVGVFMEAWVDVFRDYLGTQIGVLPALMVYTSLTQSMGLVAALAVMGGLWLDSLSCNPLGVTILPLFIAGMLIHIYRELLLKENLFAQSVLGAAASVVCPLGTVFLLLNGGEAPPLGWKSIWQFVVMGLGGAALTPILFVYFELLNRTFNYQPATQSSFRPDREIRYK
jgi:rod shape-determining protein MreD